MNTKSLLCGLTAGALALAGCTQNGTTANAGRHADPEDTRRMITGSHVPQPVDRPTFDNVAATAPSQGSGRLQPSLIPTEPTVGARGQSEYRLNESSTGAGPEGEPSVRRDGSGATPDATPRPTPRTTRKPKPQPTPTPTPQ